MEKLNINQRAAEDRPREKMMQKGAEALSDAELLAILIGSGNTEETAVTLMQRILAACGNDLNRLGKWRCGTSPDSKAWRLPKASPSWHPWNWANAASARHPANVPPSGLFHRHLPAVPSPAARLAHREIPGSLLLNQTYKGIDKVRISRGGIDQTTADVRAILREALLQRATQIALDNHPSGNVRPSNDDLLG